MEQNLIFELSQSEQELINEQFKYFEDYVQKIPQHLKNIKQKLESQNIINEYKNPQIIQQLKIFQKNCTHYRGIKGDGNCFFRAFGFGYLETIFQDLKQYEEILKQLLINLEKNQTNFTEIEYEFVKSAPQNNFMPFYSNQYITSSIQAGLKYLYNQYTKPCPNYKTLDQFLNENLIFDFCLIMFLRIQTLKQFQNDDFIPLLGYTEAELQNEQQRIKQYGSESQDTDMTMTYKFFKINVITHKVDKNEYATIDAGIENPLFTLDLFFRPGHYDYCYRESDFEQNYLKLQIKNKMKFLNLAAIEDEDLDIKINSLISQFSQEGQLKAQDSKKKNESQNNTENGQKTKCNNNTNNQQNYTNSKCQDESNIIPKEQKLENLQHKKDKLDNDITEQEKKSSQKKETLQKLQQMNSQQLKNDQNQTDIQIKQPQQYQQNNNSQIQTLEQKKQYQKQQESDGSEDFEIIPCENEAQKIQKQDQHQSQKIHSNKENNNNNQAIKPTF